MLSRRFLLFGVAGVALAGASCGAPSSSSNEALHLANMAELSALLQALPGAEYESMRRTFPNIRSLRDAHAALAEVGALDATDGVQSWLDDTRARQFDEGDVVDVDGWEFARVEALMMLASFLQGRTLAIGPKAPAAEQIDADAAEDMMLLQDMDFGGGDVAQRQITGDLDACVAACLEDDECRAFTYGRLTHDHMDQRGACYLKGRPVRPRVDARYISGVRR